MKHRHQLTVDVDQPWVIWRYGFTHDRWWPPHTSTRFRGSARIMGICAVCGHEEMLTFPIARVGPVTPPAGGRRPEAVRFLLAHLHPDRGAPMSWAMPLLNPAVHDGIDLDALAMRLEADTGLRFTPVTMTTTGDPAAVDALTDLRRPPDPADLEPVDPDSPPGPI